MGMMHGILVFLEWWGHFIWDGICCLCYRDNKLRLKTIIIIAGIIALLMTPLFLTVQPDPSESSKLERKN
jgi:hypothetical protein